MTRLFLALLGAMVLSWTLATAAATAQPVEYVKICDAFGAGYNYIPGTDHCVNQQTGVIRDPNTGATLGLTQPAQNALDAQQQAQDAQKAADDAQKAADKAKEGVALSLALPKATVTPGHQFAAAANIGVFEGETALGFGAAYQLNDNVTLNGALGAGLQHGAVGGNAGVNISW